MATLTEQVSQIICEQLGVAIDAVTPGTRFVEDLGADSLAMVELVLAMEERFDVTISDEQAQEIRTVAEAVAFVERHSPAHRGSRAAS